MREDSNVNVTLGKERPDDTFFKGKQFPCPLCGQALDLRTSRRNKPYCHCDSCGIQIFFRGKAGIKRLRHLIESQSLVCSKDSGASQAITLYNRLEQLKAQKKELEGKQLFVLIDPDLDKAIAAVDAEIVQVQAELEDLKPDGEPEKRK